MLLDVFFGTKPLDSLDSSSSVMKFPNRASFSSSLFSYCWQHSSHSGPRPRQHGSSQNDAILLTHRNRFVYIPGLVSNPEPGPADGPIIIRIYIRCRMVGTCIMDYKAPPPRATPSGSRAL